jgi:hypothetical protein
MDASFSKDDSNLALKMTTNDKEFKNDCYF